MFYACHSIKWSFEISPSCCSHSPKTATMLDDIDFLGDGGEEVTGGTAAGNRRGRGRGKGKGRGQASVAKQICIVPECVSVCANNTKFCKQHHGAWVTLENQQDSEDEEAQQQLVELKERGNDTDRGQAVFDFCLLNPLDAKYQKKIVFSVVQYRKDRFVRAEKKERTGGEKPMTKKAFIAHCKYKLGLDEEEYLDWWSEMLDDLRVERPVAALGGSG